MPKFEDYTRLERARILVDQGYDEYAKLLKLDHWLAVCDGMARASKTDGYLPDIEPEPTWARTLRLKAQGRD